MAKHAPARMLDGLSPGQAEAVQQWWRHLPDAERRALSPLWNDKSDSCAYTRAEASDGKKRFLKIPLRVVGRFVDPRDRSEANEIPNVDFYEYLVNHEIFLDDVRASHICSAHPEARAAVSAGHIPADFDCPIAKSGCPMRALLAADAGRSIVLSLAPAARPPWAYLTGGVGITGGTRK